MRTVVTVLRGNSSSISPECCALHRGYIYDISDSRSGSTISMGSSAKKKKEKKKDFQKPKLRVGKTIPKAANSTSTSFKAKQILVNQQINVNAPSLRDQFLHHVSLLSSRSDSQRKESVSYLTSTLQNEIRGNFSFLPMKDFLEKIMPLLLDSNSGVRTEMAKLFQALPRTEIGDYAEPILPYVRAGMTHLSHDIRRITLDLLSNFIKTSGKQIVSAPGGFCKTLQCFTTNLGFKHYIGHESWSVHKTAFREDTKSIARTMQVAEQLLTAGLLDDLKDVTGSLDPAQDFPLWHFACHKIPCKSNPYGYLNLFGKPLDNASRQLEDRDERVQAFRDQFYDKYTSSLERAKTEGGEVGRSAGQLLSLIETACKLD